MTSHIRRIDRFHRRLRKPGSKRTQPRRAPEKTAAEVQVHTIAQRRRLPWRRLEIQVQLDQASPEARHAGGRGFAAVRHRHRGGRRAEFDPARLIVLQRVGRCERNRRFSVNR